MKNGWIAGYKVAVSSLRAPGERRFLAALVQIGKVRSVSCRSRCDLSYAAFVRADYILKLQDSEQ
jgi:hypothetical protein